MDEKSLSYPETLKKFRSRYNEADVIKKIMNEISLEINELKSYRTCISIGTGYGEFDIDFINICLPSLRKLIVVEQNPDCVQELKVNLKNAFGYKVEVEIHEMKIENFMKMFKGSNIDIVISFHALYFLTPTDRCELISLSFDSWLNNRGLFLFTNVSKGNDILNIFTHLNCPLPKSSEKMKDEIKQLGLLLMKEIPYAVDFDLGEYGDDIYYIYKPVVKGNLTQDMMVKAVREAVPSGLGSFSAELCVVAKTS